MAEGEISTALKQSGSFLSFQRGRYGPLKACLTHQKISNALVEIIGSCLK
jgi:hypothetical protein